MRYTHAGCFVLVTLAVCSLSAVAPADTDKEPVLAAHFTFDEGEGAILHDTSGNEIHGVIHNAQWVKTPAGGAVKFARTDSYVDFGPDSALKIAGDMSIVAWLKLEAQPYPDNETNWVIVDCEEYKKSGFLVRIEGSNSTVRYRSSQEGAAQQRGSSIALTNNTFYHVTVTKKGETAALFINGALDQRFSVKDPARGSVPFMISSKQQSFSGLIDDVKIHNRALSAEEVRAAYEEGKGSRVVPEAMLMRSRLDAGAELKGEGFTLRVGPGGGTQIEIGDDVYFVESSFSYPGEKIGYNYLSEAENSGDIRWKPAVRPADSDSIAILASGDFCCVERTLTLQGHRVLVSDRLSNTSDGDVAIMVRNALISAARPAEWRLCGVPGTASAKVTENPTVLLSQERSRLGAVADDNISRAQFEAAAAANYAGFQLPHLGLAPGKSVTLEWYLYPLQEGEDYWTFINRIRDDWNVNYRIDGPADMLHVFRDKYWRIFTDKGALGAFLDRSRLKVIQLAWLDFNHQNQRTGELVSRDDYRRMMRQLKETVDAIDPSVRLVGNTEAPYVSLPRALCERLYAVAPERPRSYYGEFTQAEMEVLRESPEEWSQWKDALVWSADGRAKQLFYSRHRLDGTFMPMVSLMVYPVLGNGQHEYMMGQARFILEEAGLDGVYFDSFTSGMHSYDQWDGVSVDIDDTTGKITRRYTDLTLAGATSRKALIEYVLSRGKVCVINGHAVARETRSLPAIRFDEMFSYVAPLAQADGEKPPLVAKLCYAHLSSPVGLGFKPDSLKDEGARRYAEVIVKAAICYLRHGVLYYHYETFIPETGSGAGEYGPFNHMFPITPVRLGEGFVEGEERVVTCVSRAFDWPRESAPTILLFDITGRPRPHEMKPTKSQNGWRVNVALADWQEIAVLEE